MSELPKKLLEWQNLPEAVDMKDDMSILYQAAKLNPPRDIFLELGTGGGLSTRALALAMQELNSGSEKPLSLLSIDIDPEKSKVVSPILIEEGIDQNVSFFSQDSITFLNNNSHHPIDFVFLDTSHDFKQTLAEIMLITPMLTAKGYLFMHDTRYNEVWDAIQAFLKGSCQFSFMDFTTSSGLGLITRKYSLWLPVNGDRPR